MTSKDFYKAMGLFLCLAAIPISAYLYQELKKPKFGCIRGNCQNGKGVFINDYGDRYEGSFNGGKREGAGVFYAANGITEEGMFKNGDIRGAIVETQPNGEKQYLIAEDNGNLYTYQELKDWWKKKNSDLEAELNEAKASKEEALALAAMANAEAEKAKRALSYRYSTEARQEERRKAGLDLLGKAIGGLADMSQKTSQCESQCEGLSNEIDEEGGFLQRATSPRQRCKKAC